MDNDAKKLAIIIVSKRNVDKLFISAQSEPDLLKQAQLFRDIGSELERCHTQLDKEGLLDDS